MENEIDWDALIESVEDEPTREEYVRDWYKSNSENRSEMRTLISNLLFKHAKDEGEYQELLIKFDDMFETKPEPEPIRPSYDPEEDNHFHHAIGNQLLVEENFWGAGGVYRIHKLYPLSSPCLNVLFEVNDD